jgi:hypothetical protein
LTEKRGQWGRVNLYLREGDRHRLELLIKLEKIKTPSEFFRKALEEATQGLDPEMRMREIEREIEKLTEEMAVCAQYAHKQGSDLDKVKEFLRSYADYRKTAGSSSKPVEWIDLRREDLPDLIKILEAGRILKVLDELGKIPDLTPKILQETIRKWS